MLTRRQQREARDRAAAMMRNAGVRLTESEVEAMDVADFGLGHLEVEGAQIVSFFNTDRVSAKVIALFPRQSLPEHWHTSFGDDPGKEETLRVIDGTACIYIPGEAKRRAGPHPRGQRGLLHRPPRGGAAEGWADHAGAGREALVPGRA